MIERDFSKKIDEALHEAVAKAIDRHRRLGESIAISENGKVKILSPEDILIRQQNSQAERK